MSSLGSSDSQSRGNSVILVLLALASFAILFGLRPAEQTGDGLDYAVSIRDGDVTFHPHHLLFIPIIRAIMTVTSSFGEAGDAVLASQIHNTLWSVIAILATYLLITRVF